MLIQFQNKNGSYWNPSNHCTAGITDPEFVDCGETIKHEIKEDGDNEYQIDPLRLFNTPQYSDHSIISILKGGCTKFIYVQLQILCIKIENIE